MASSLLDGHKSSFSTRLYIPILIVVYFCFCCSASPFITSIIDVDPLANSYDNYDNDVNEYIPFYYYRGVPSRDHSNRDLLQSIFVQRQYRSSEYGDKRNYPQAFHAMRG